MQKHLQCVYALAHTSRSSCLWSCKDTAQTTDGLLSASELQHLQVCVAAQNGVRAPKRRKASAAAPAPSQATRQLGQQYREPEQQGPSLPYRNGAPRPPSSTTQPAGRFTFTPRVRPPQASRIPACMQHAQAGRASVVEAVGGLKPVERGCRATCLSAWPVQDLPDAAFEDAQSPVPALQGLLKTLAALEPEDQRQLLRHPSLRTACNAARHSLHRIPEQASRSGSDYLSGCHGFFDQHLISTVTVHAACSW